MEVKKTKQADMTRRSGLYFLIGLNIVLLITLLFFEFWREDVIKEPEDEAPEVVVVDEDVIVTERQFDQPPPEVDVPPPPDIPVEIEVVPDEVVLEKPEEIAPQENQELQTFKVETGVQEKTPPSKPVIKKPEKPQVQETPDVEIDISTAKVAPIYPGCEKFKGDNRKLYQCFNERFGSDIAGSLDQNFELEPGQKVKVMIAFKIDKDGNLKISKVNKGKADMDFVNNATSAFNRVASTMERRGRKGKGITPALNSSNKPAVMKYSIPVAFTGQ